MPTDQYGYYPKPKAGGIATNAFIFNGRRFDPRRTKDVDGSRSFVNNKTRHAHARKARWEKEQEET